MHLYIYKGTELVYKTERTVSYVFPLYTEEAPFPFVVYKDAKEFSLHMLNFITLKESLLI